MSRLLKLVLLALTALALQGCPHRHHHIPGPPGPHVPLPPGAPRPPGLP